MQRESTPGSEGSNDVLIGQLALDYRTARIEGKEFDVESKLNALPENIRERAREALQASKLLLDAGKK